MLSSKNLSLSPATADLGLGDQLKTQVEDDIEQRKKKLLGSRMGMSGGLGPATLSLFNMSGGANG